MRPNYGRAERNILVMYTFLNICNTWSSSMFVFKVTLIGGSLCSDITF